MGNGSFLCEDIPAISNNKTFIREEVQVLDKTFEVNAMLMGVPHAVILVDNISIEEVCKYGPLLEKDKIFPTGTNVNFVKIEDDNKVASSYKILTQMLGSGMAEGKPKKDLLNDIYKAELNEVINKRQAQILRKQLDGYNF